MNVKLKAVLALVFAFVGISGTHGQCRQPVALPPLRFWRIALSCVDGKSPVRAVSAAASTDRAWQSYLNGDFLGARVELTLARNALASEGIAASNPAALARAASMAILLAGPASEPRQSLAEELTGASPHWRADATLGPWVDVFEGGLATANHDGPRPVRTGLPRPRPRRHRRTHVAWRISAWQSSRWIARSAMKPKRTSRPPA